MIFVHSLTTQNIKCDIEKNESSDVYTPLVRLQVICL